MLVNKCVVQPFLFSSFEPGTFKKQTSSFWILEYSCFFGLTSRLVFSRGGDLEAPEENGYLVPNPNMTDIKVDVRSSHGEDSNRCWFMTHTAIYLSIYL